MEESKHDSDYKELNGTNGEDHETIDLDKVNAGKTYCSWKWALGFFLIVVNVICHALVLPHIDLTLISCNAATAIIVNMLLSIFILGEKFIPKYDLTAMFLITIGSVTIVIHANTEQVEFTAEEIRDMLA